MNGTFTLTIYLGNSWMREPFQLADAIEQAAKAVRETIDHEDDLLVLTRSVRDLNGNAVGRWGFVDDGATG